MSRAIITESKLTAIADAIRSRFGVSGSMTVDEMAETILPSLPSAYQQVEYIETTGTQYINTGIVPTSTTRVILEKAYTTNATRSIDGVWDANKDFCVGLNFARTSMCIAVGDDNSWRNVAVYDTDFHTYDLANGSQKFDGTEKATTSFAGATTTFRIGKIAGSGGDYTMARYKSLRIFTGDSLIMGLIPCYRKSDNVIGMYDLVTDTFYTNAGTGTFTKGADV